MKKILLNVFLVVIAVATSKAQVFYSDDFSNQSLPGWQAVNHNSSAVIWHWSNTATTPGQYPGTFNSAGATNGHVRIDSDNFGVSGTPEYSTFTSAAINCTGKPVVVLKFTEYFRKYQSDSGTVSISNDSVNWNQVHVSSSGLNTNEGTENPNFVVEDISAVAANQATVYIRFSWWGEYDYYWFVDDVSLSVPDAEDAVATRGVTLLSNGCQLTNAEPVQIVVTANGMNPIDTVMVHYQINNGAVVSEQAVFQPPLQFGDSYTYTFTATADFSAPNAYIVGMWVDLANDTAHYNDTTASFSVSVVPSTIPYTMGFEIPEVGGPEFGGYAWATEDANADGYGWVFAGEDPYAGSVNYTYLFNEDGQTAADDWLFSPCLSLDASKAYKLSFFAEVGEDNNGLYEEQLEVKIGTDNDAVSMTGTIRDFGVFNNSAYEEKKAAFKPATTGTHYVGFHCYSDPDKWFLNIDDISITELAPPNAAFTSTMNGSNVTLADASTELITRWVWYWGDGDSTVAEVPGTHNYGVPGSYTICLYVTNLAGIDSMCSTVVISGINETDASAQVAVFPNPTNQVLNIAMGEAFVNGGKIEIVNLLGETLISRNSTTNSTEKFDLSKLTQGVYYVRITSGELKAVKRFVYTR